MSLQCVPLCPCSVLTLNVDSVRLETSASGTLKTAPKSAYLTCIELPAADMPVDPGGIRKCLCCAVSGACHPVLSPNPPASHGKG